MLPVSLFAWSAVGHRLVAQIAYLHLTEEAKILFSTYNDVVNTQHRPLSFIEAAVWLDRVRGQDPNLLQEKHFINLPHSPDGSRLFPPKPMNAVRAIEEAITILGNGQATAYEKGVQLRIILHVVGDLHQPLHTISWFSKDYPFGDKGGNLVYLAKNPVAKNLHAYWDQGGGFLKKAKRRAHQQVMQKAMVLESQSPCIWQNMSINPAQWAEESKAIAINKAYLLKKGEKPNKQYAGMVKNITQQQIALAGCRLAALLNHLALS